MMDPVMSRKQQDSHDPRIMGVVTELEEIIAQQYPTVMFEVFEGEDPPGIYLRATVDSEDPDQLMDLVIDRLLPLQVEERLPLYFIAARRNTRALAEIHTPHPIRPNVSVSTSQRETSAR